MQLRTLGMVAALCLGLAGSARADALLGFSGFDYEDPDLEPGFLATGEGYHLVGMISEFGGQLLPWVDPFLNHYTLEVSGMTVRQSSFNPPFLIVLFNDEGRARCHEDAIAGGTPATYGLFPPNITTPSTFVDGTLILGGRVDNGALIFDYRTNEGQCSGDLALNEGTHLVYIPPALRSGLTLSFRLSADTFEPEGFDYEVTGAWEWITTTPTKHNTWGAVKSLYH